ncbi:MAG: DsbA family protein [Rhizobiaceae bacterium]
MNKSVLSGILAALVCAASVGAGYFAGQANSAVTSVDAEPAIISAGEPANTAEIEAIVRNYLLKNPEIINEVEVALETQKEQEAKDSQLAYLAGARPELFNNPNDAIVGNPNGDVTVVEFFDYNCGYCRRALNDMEALTQADPNVRFVLKELPILGPDSVKAHIVAQAFRKLMPDKYIDFHRALLTSSHADEASAIATAVSLGADEAKLREGMSSPEIGALFAQNNEIALALNITGTPSYVIKDAIVPGAMGVEVLSQNVANVRKCQSATC